VANYGQEFLLRVKRKGELEYFVGRRYGDFSRLHKATRLELPGKVLPSMPKKNKTDSTTTNLFASMAGGKDSEDDSISSVSTQQTGLVPNAPSGDGSLSLTVRNHRKAGTTTSGRNSPRTSTDERPNSPMLFAGKKDGKPEVRPKQLLTPVILTW
jgi:hypothetical protein